MKVTKRNGDLENVNLNKITERIRKLKFIKEIDRSRLNVDEILIAKKVIDGLYDKVSTKELDNLAAQTSAGMVMKHPDYDKMAARIEVSSLHKETLDNFSSKIDLLFNSGSIGKSYRDYVFSNNVIDNTNQFDLMIDYSRDYLIDYFGIKTLKKSYLLRDGEKNVVERPQDMWMRVASFVHQDSMDDARDSYNLMSNKYFTHATPTLFNAGLTRPQLSSCFLLDIESDSIRGIYKTLQDCALISQSAGGIGLSIQKIRSKGSNILGTNGVSNGLVPMLRVFDSTMRYVDQGGGKRKGSAAMYIEPWHADIFDFLELKKNHGKEELRARDLFYAMWIPDLFMQRVEEDGRWTLFDPKGKEELSSLVSEDFRIRYEELENRKIGREIKARDLWNKILESQIETGTPYMLYKDACNIKSNQKNLGTIKSSNLCTEIIEYTSPKETAVCNLASISLPNFIKKGEVDYHKLYDVSRFVCKSLDKVIDLTYYPIPEAKRSNESHRPIGIGVQGLADLFAILKLDFDEEEAQDINKKIFETIYKGAADESIERAKVHGTYESYEGSPTSEGKLQFDLWKEVDKSKFLFEWKDTRRNLRKHGLRNSLLLAPMPTASTSQILGNNECFEPFTNNIYTRRTLSGEFIVVNKHLVKDLIDLDLWDDDMKNRIVAAKGSIQNFNDIPTKLKSRYRTVWEISQRSIIDMAADRGIFICQSQSMNLFVKNPTFNKLTSMHFYGWKKGLKTGSYYIRSTAAVDAIQFTVPKEHRDNQKELDFKENEVEITGTVCDIEDPDCISCSG